MKKNLENDFKIWNAVIQIQKDTQRNKKERNERKEGRYPLIDKI